MGFLRIVLASVLACACLLRMLAAPYALADYTLRKAYIAKNLCENRDKPAMHCDGQCHLKKKLAIAQEPTTPVPAKGSKGTAKSLMADWITPDKPFVLRDVAVTDGQCIAIAVKTTAVLADGAYRRLLRPPWYLVA